MQIQRHSRRRRGLAVLAAVLVAVPAIAASRALADGVFGPRLAVAGNRPDAFRAGAAAPLRTRPRLATPAMLGA